MLNYVRQRRGKPRLYTSGVQQRWNRYSGDPAYHITQRCQHCGWLYAWRKAYKDVLPLSVSAK